MLSSERRVWKARGDRRCPCRPRPRLPSAPCTLLPGSSCSSTTPPARINVWLRPQLSLTDVWSQVWAGVVASTLLRSPGAGAPRTAPLHHSTSNLLPACTQRIRLLPNNLRYHRRYSVKFPLKMYALKTNRMSQINSIFSFWKPLRLVRRVSHRSLAEGTPLYPPLASLWTLAQGTPLLLMMQTFNSGGGRELTKVSPVLFLHLHRKITVQGTLRCM